MSHAKRTALGALGGLVLSVALGLSSAWAGPMDLGGQFAVSESGAATYSIPIQVPPGIGGMEPKLALSYNSQTGNGLLGMGWSLSGLSAITRCGRTLAQDGVKGGINFDSNDRYCLDGQRLVAITTGAYGADGTEYRTERESFSKIVSYGVAGSGPAWFKVWTKAGQILEYGNSADSRIEAQGKTSARVWAINKISDTKDNALTFSYTKDTANGDYVPSRIDYTGNAAASLAPANSVRFVYEARPDSIPGYFAGSLVKSTQRLATLQTYAGATLANEYRFGYQTSIATFRSVLQNVRKCDPANQCLPGLTFTWGSNVGVWQSSVAYIPSMVSIGTDIGADMAVRFVDLNGDGLPDIVRNLLFVSTGGHAQDAYLNTGTGWVAAPNYIPSMVTIGTDGGIDQGVRFVDLNGDGLPDFVRHRLFTNSGAHEQDAYLNTGTGWIAAPNYIPPVPLTQDGNAADRGVRFIDLNGDGLPDLVQNYLNSSGAHEQSAYLNTGSGWVAAPNFVPDMVTIAMNGADMAVRFVDLNGDGLPDIVRNLLSTSTGGHSQDAYLNTSMPDLLSVVSTGLGAAVTITYRLLADKAVYTKDSGANAASFPRIDLQMPMYVAASVVSSNGVGGTHTTNYKYGGLKAEVGTGRGLLGFRWMEATSAETGLTTRTEHRQDWPYVGLPSQIKKTMTGAAGPSNQVSLISNTYECTNPPANTVPCVVAPGNRYFPHAKQSIENGWDFNGAALPTVTTENQFDDFGNATEVKVSTSDGYSKTTTNTYQNDTANWYLGRLLRSQVQSVTP